MRKEILVKLNMMGFSLLNPKRPIKDPNSIPLCYPRNKNKCFQFEMIAAGCSTYAQLDWSLLRWIVSLITGWLPYNSIKLSFFHVWGCSIGADRSKTHLNWSIFHRSRSSWLIPTDVADHFYPLDDLKLHLLSARSGWSSLNAYH